MTRGYSLCSAFLVWHKMLICPDIHVMHVWKKSICIHIFFEGRYTFSIMHPLLNLLNVVVIHTYMYIVHMLMCTYIYIYVCVVGGLEHFWFFPIVGMMIQSDFHIFQRGWNHQPGIERRRPLKPHAAERGAALPTAWVELLMDCSC